MSIWQGDITRLAADAIVIGAGANTPVIIKYPFWQMTNDNPKAVYACVNYNEAFCPKQIEEQSICLEGDAGVILDLIK